MVTGVRTGGEPSGAHWDHLRWRPKAVYEDWEWCILALWILSQFREEIVEVVLIISKERISDCVNDPIVDVGEA